jgi:hypothetical protein
MQGVEVKHMKGVEASLLNSRVRSLELELKILKAQLAQTAVKSEPLSALYGLLKGQSASTYKEIQEAKYREREETL